MATLGEGFGNAMEQGQQDYGSIMGGLQGLAGGGGNISAGRVGYSDPFGTSYDKFKQFSDTGGYSANDIADLRARGVAPIRAAYANAGREVGRQRALQGGYSPNATATLAKMAREQSQGGADALQNVNAGIVNQRNANQLSGIQGMTGIDTSRLNAELDASKSNAQYGLQADAYNQGNMLDAYKTMGSLYGTTPGMANMFGTQLGNAIQNSGAQGSSYITGETQAQTQPGAFQNTANKIQTGADIATGIGNPILNYYQNKNKGTTTGKPVNSPYPWENSVYGN
jgi:hypothetical protein